MSPREARLGRWVLLYGILQVLSNLSVDVQGLKHTDGVRYFLNTDLKRMPEWVSNGQIEHLEARQQRSWCWQRAWDPVPAQAAPVELEATTSTSNERTNQHDNREETRHAEIAAHNFPSPPPQQALPLPPPSAAPHSLDGATLMQNDLRRLGEKINNLSLSHNAGVHFQQEIEQRRENEKVIQDEFHDRKPRLQGETFGPRAARDQSNNINMTHGTNGTYNPPRLDSLRPRSRDTRPPQRSHSRADDTFLLTDSDYSNDFITRHQASLLPPPLTLNTRSHTTSLNTDLGSYPFSAADNDNGDDMQWPVPPGYNESTRDRDMGTWREGRGGRERESTVLGEGYRVLNFEDGGFDARERERERGTDAGMQGTGVRRAARRVGERGVWDT
jgi:hypothetical protein